MAIQKPIVSVIVPVFNEACKIANALHSVRAQAVEDWECLVVDDGSTDATVESVRKIGDSRIRVVSLTENRGRGAARALGMAQCSGAFVAMLDADDWWYPWKLSQQLSYFDTWPLAGACASAVGVVDHKYQLVGVWRTEERGHVVLKPALHSMLGFRITHGTVLMRTELAKSHEYDPRLRRSEDRHFLARSLADAPYCLSGDVLYSYSTSSRDLTRPTNRYLWRIRSDWLLRNRYPISAGLSMCRSLLQVGVAVLAASTGSSRPLRFSSPLTPSTEDFAEHREAWQQLQAVKQSQLILDSGQPNKA